jgi:class 3 adenylate cyclase
LAKPLDEIDLETDSTETLRGALASVNHEILKLKATLTEFSVQVSGFKRQQVLDTISHCEEVRQQLQVELASRDGRKGVAPSDPVGHAPKDEHKVCAIAFSDIKGYSRLTSIDQTRSLAILNEHNDICEAIIKKHDGRVIKHIGDGIMSTYGSALDAVR